MIKRLVALFLVLLLSIESFAAVVGDNDGAAFITKAEFDSLKNTFQLQIDQYNSSIDNKIDGAIAGYLTGLNIATQHKLTLDPACHYSFPMVMFSQGEYWNDPSNEFYFNLSIPRYDYYATYVMADANNTEIKYKETNPSNQPLVLNNGDDATGTNRFVRAGIYNQAEQFPGSNGYLNVLKRDTSVVRNGNRGYELVGEGIGQFYKLYLAQPTQITRFGGWGGTNYWYQYANFYGFSANQLTQTNGKLSYTANTSGYRYWEDHGMYGWAFNITLSKFNKIALSSKKNLNELITLWNQEIDTYGQTNAWNNIMGAMYTPKFELTVWAEANARKALYAKNSFMPASLEGRWRYIPYFTNDATKMKVFVVDNPNAAQWVAAWNFTGTAKEVYWYQGTKYAIHPQWIAEGNPTGTADNVNSFSRICAQQVFYYDSNGKRHFMDEGMYLGTYENDGTVSFKLRFTSTTNTDVNFAISKQPFGHDSIDSNRISFKCNTSTISQGNFATVNPYRDLVITIDEISIGDELYLMWWPVDSKKDCKLDSFTEYSITY